MVTETPEGTQTRSATIRHLQRQASTLASEAIARMDATLPWYRAMSAEHRSWVGVVARNGITSFIDWYRQPGHPPQVSADVFRSAPREMARAVSLQQTVELVRATIAVIEEHVAGLAQPAQHRDLHDAVLLYSREVAFAAAGVYAQAAESRGAWDARLEALVVDALVRNDAAAGPDDPGLRSRAAALGWGAPAQVVTLVGHVSGAQTAGASTSSVARLQRTARGRGLDVLTGVHGPRLLAILGCNPSTPEALTADLAHLASLFGEGPVVIGPTVEDLLQAGSSLAQALAGLDACAAWPQAPALLHSDQVLPERALSGDSSAKNLLLATMYQPLASEPDLLRTAATYLEQTVTVEATARQLFIHPNTVRYRLRRISELTGATLTEPRDALSMRLALMLGRLISE